MTSRRAAGRAALGNALSGFLCDGEPGGSVRQSASANPLKRPRPDSARSSNFDKDADDEQTVSATPSGGNGESSRKQSQLRTGQERGGGGAPGTVLAQIAAMQQPLRGGRQARPHSELGRQPFAEPAAHPRQDENRPPADCETSGAAGTWTSSKEVELQRLRKENPNLKKQIANLQGLIRDKDELILKQQQTLTELLEKADVPEFLEERKLKAAGVKIKNAVMLGDQWFSDVFPEEETLKRAYAAELGVHGQRNTVKFNQIWEKELGKKAVDGFRYKRHELIKGFRKSLLQSVHETVRAEEYAARRHAYESAKADDPEAEVEFPKLPSNNEIVEKVEEKKRQLLDDNSWVNGSGTDRGFFKGLMFRRAFSKALYPAHPPPPEPQIVANRQILGLFLYVGELALADQALQTTRVDLDRKKVREYAAQIDQAYNQLGRDCEHLELLERRARPRDVSSLSAYKILEGDEMEDDAEEEGGE